MKRDRFSSLLHTIISAETLHMQARPLSSRSLCTVIDHNRRYFTKLIGDITIQVAQLSQRDRAAGWVSNGQKWKTGTERQYLRTM